MSSKKSSSDKMVIPKSSAFFNLEPAPGPATRKSVFLLTDPLALPPCASAISFALFRLNWVKAPVNTMVFPSRI